MWEGWIKVTPTRQGISLTWKRNELKLSSQIKPVFMEIISIFVNENDLKALSAALNNLNEVFISSLAVFVRFIDSAQCSLRGCLHGGRKILAPGRSEKAEKLFVCFTCRNFGRSGYQVEKEKKNNCRPWAAERPAAAMFVLFVPSTRIFRAKVVYMVLGSS